MTVMLTILCRVIQRRMDAGEQLEAILLDYPRLTAEEVAEVTTAVTNSNT